VRQPDVDPGAQARVSDWEKESPSLIAAAESLRITENVAP